MDDNISRMMAPYLLITLQNNRTRIVDMNEPKYLVRGLIPNKVAALVKVLEKQGWRRSFPTNNIVLNMPDRRTNVLEIVDGNHRIAALKIMQKRLQEMNQKGKEIIPHNLKDLLDPNFAIHVITLVGAPRGLCLVIGQDYNDTSIFSNYYFYDSIVNTRSWMLCAFEDTSITPQQKKSGRPSNESQDQEPDQTNLIDMPRPATFRHVTKLYIVRYMVACLELASATVHEVERKRILSTAQTEQ